MKIAIPEWKHRVSPVLDTSQCLLIYDIGEDQILLREEASIKTHDLLTRANQINQYGVDVLICGAVSWQLENLLISSGIHVISRICGDIEDVIQAYLDNRIEEERFMMPGCCKRRRRRRRRQYEHDYTRERTPLN